MKITFFIGSLYGGGAERVVCNLANYLVNHNHVVRILTMSESRKRYDLSQEVTHDYLLSDDEKSNPIIDTLKRVVRLLRYVKNNTNDVYVVFLPVTILLLLFFRYRVKSKIVASERNSPTLYNVITRILLKLTASKADAWVFQTEAIKAWYDGSIKNLPTALIPNAINSEFLVEINRSDIKKTIVSVGRLSNQKRFDILIKAFSIVHEQCKDYTLEIYGDGPNRNALEALISEYQLCDNVSLQGNKSPIFDYINDAAVFVLTSDYEGMPNALIEAMAMGIPSIATDCIGGGVKYLIEDCVNGILVPRGDYKKVADAIIWMIDHPNEAHAIGYNARKIVDNLSPEIVYGQWEKFIDSIVCQK